MQHLPTHSSQGFPHKLWLLLTPSQGGLLEHPAGTGQDCARYHRTPAAAAGCAVPGLPGQLERSTFSHACHEIRISCKPSKLSPSPAWLLGPTVPRRCTELSDLFVGIRIISNRRASWYVGIFLQDGSIFQNDEGRKTIPVIVHLFAIKNTLSFVLSSFA